MVDMKLELVIIPVSDVDRAKAFYTDKIGFIADHDHTVSDEIRFVQLTPPGSACSIAIGRGIVEGAPGSVRGLQMVVTDIEAAHAELLARGAGSSSSPTRTATSGRCSSCRPVADRQRLSLRAVNRAALDRQLLALGDEARLCFGHGR
jgi:catechol 2,3-dioxygenase-like lactoylglutathione lyase family enzyme